MIWWENRLCCWHMFFFCMYISRLWRLPRRINLNYFRTPEEFIVPGLHSKYIPFHRMLAQWGLDKMVATLRTAFLKTSSLQKILAFLLRFHWNLFLNIQFAISWQWFKLWLGTEQVTSANYYQIHWRIYMWELTGLHLCAVANSYIFPQISCDLTHEDTDRHMHGRWSVHLLPWQTKSQQYDCLTCPRKDVNVIPPKPLTIR